MNNQPKMNVVPPGNVIPITSNTRRVNSLKKNNNRRNQNKSMNKSINSNNINSLNTINNSTSTSNNNMSSSMSNNMNNMNNMNNVNNMKNINNLNNLNNNNNNKNNMKNMNNNSSRKLNEMANPFVKRMLESIHTIKLFHWKTKSYATHKATDGLHGTLNELVDKFVEVLVGKYNLNLSMDDFKSLTITNLPDNSELEQFVKDLCKYLSNISFTETETDLANIRDEILGELNQFLYLLRLQ
jgi:hypothetical protein